MLIPYNTDAPIYHWPIATGGMILANCLAYMGLMMLKGSVDEDTFAIIVRELCLSYGRGPRPWQWFTSIFMHAGLLHLLGNMFCLWGFGLVVEGKLGWWRFLAVYVFIGVVQSSLEQMLMLFGTGLSLGASSVVYGLLAMCMVWAPRNEMSCVFLAGLRPYFFDAAMTTIAGVAFFIEIATGMFIGLKMSSQVLHLMGGGVGFALGVWMLRKGWVDCEGWDLFNVMRGTQNKPREDNQAEAEKLLDEVYRKKIRGDTPPVAAPEPSVPTTLAFTPSVPEPLIDPLIQQMRDALAGGDLVRAFACFEQFASDPLNWPLPERELLQIINALHQQKRWSESVPPMVAYLQHFTERAASVRLKLAHVLIEIERRPAQAQAVLAKLDESQLNDRERPMVAKLQAAAEHMLTQQPAEESLEDW